MAWLSYRVERVGRQVHMPRIARGQIISDRTSQETLAEKVKAGKAVPLVSHMVDHNLLLQGHQALVQDYAKRIEYPWANLHDLAHITQVRSVTHFSTDFFAMRKEYLDLIKNRLCDIAEDEG